jgi:hypothetical protein
VAAKETAEIKVNESEIKATDIALKINLMFIIFPPFLLSFKHKVKRFTTIFNYYY